MSDNNHPKRGGRRGPHVIPTPKEILKAQLRAGWSDTQCAERLCVSPETFTAWAWGTKPMPAGAWKLMRYELGMMLPGGVVVHRGNVDPPPGDYKHGWPVGDPRKR